MDERAFDAAGDELALDAVPAAPFDAERRADECRRDTTIVDELLVGEPGDGGGDFVGGEAALRELVLELSGGVVASAEEAMAAARAVPPGGSVRSSGCERGGERVARRRSTGMSGSESVDLPARPGPRVP